ncbi:MAG: tetratricopeptide repeat protein [Spirochaetales bacterium]|nr:MAG: tetratricopeptide repeat protein [Spirochaetales bacterium]
MKKLFFVFFFSVLLTGTIFADGRPLADGIEEYAANYSIEPHIPEMLEQINDASMEYNRQGYALYEQRRYEEAISKFQQAISADSDNSFAMYNMACCYALMGKENSAKVAGILERVGGYWVVQLMVDPDLDALRNFDTGGANYWDSYGRECLLFSGGKALIQTSSEGSKGPVTEGYYCVIGEYVFMFFDIPAWEIFGSHYSYRMIYPQLVRQVVPISKLSFKEVSEVGFYKEYEQKHK